MALRRMFNRQKAIEAMLFVVPHRSDLYEMLKIIYFADKKHLERYGRFMFGDKYTSFEHGPAPSGAYGILKYAMGDMDLNAVSAPVQGALTVEDRKTIKILRQPDLQRLSDSEVECLREAVAENAHRLWEELRDMSKDPAWFDTPQGHDIPITKIARTLPEPELLLDYLLTS